MYVELETPPFMEKSILNFHFDYLKISLILCLGLFSIVPVVVFLSCFAGGV